MDEYKMPTKIGDNTPSSETTDAQRACNIDYDTVQHYRYDRHGAIGVLLACLTGR